MAASLREELEEMKMTLRRARSGEETLRIQLQESENSLAKSHSAEKEIGIRVRNQCTLSSIILSHGPYS